MPTPDRAECGCQESDAEPSLHRLAARDVAPSQVVEDRGRNAEAEKREAQADGCLIQRRDASAFGTERACQQDGGDEAQAGGGYGGDEDEVYVEQKAA